MATESDRLDELKEDTRKLQQIISNINQSSAELETATRNLIKTAGNINSAQITIFKQMVKELSSLMAEFSSAREDIKESKEEIIESDGWQ